MTISTFGRMVALTSAVALMAGAAHAQVVAPRASTEFSLATDQPRTVEQEALKIDKVDWAIKVMPTSQTIEATATLDFTATGPVSALVVELDTAFDITSVKVDGRTVAAGRWTNPEGRLTVPLRRALRAGGKAQLTVAYSGAPRIAPMAPWDGGFVWRKTPDGLPWISTAIQGEGCDLLWPCIDHPLAEPARFDSHITIPSELAAPGNGRFLGKTDHGDGWTTWNWSARQPNTYAVALDIAPYNEISADFHSRYGNVIPMTYWYLRSDDPQKVQALFAEFEPMMRFYEDKIGPFPFGDEKMGVVETPHLGMEHQTKNAYGNQYRLDGKGYDWLLHHELAHEWFGNQMTNVNADDMWLHEGLGSYMQPLYLGWMYGERAMERELAEQRLGVANRFPVVSGTNKTEDEVYFGGTGPGNDIYVKGSLIAHSLRLLIGDEAFYTSLRRLIYGRADPAPGNFQARNASTPEFLKIASEEAGQDLTWFFRGYLYNAALPRLSETREGDLLKLEWTTGDGGAFPMPLEIEIGGEVVTVPMTDGRGEVRIPDGAHIRIDPFNKVLRYEAHIDRYQQAVIAGQAE